MAFHGCWGRLQLAGWIGIILGVAATICRKLSMVSHSLKLVNILSILKLVFYFNKITT
jgi:hypothetical protein